MCILLHSKTILVFLFFKVLQLWIRLLDYWNTFLPFQKRQRFFLARSTEWFSFGRRRGLKSAFRRWELEDRWDEEPKISARCTEADSSPTNFQDFLRIVLPLQHPKRYKITNWFRKLKSYQRLKHLKKILFFFVDFEVL